MILQCQMWGSWGADRGDIPLDAQQGLELNEPHHQDPDAQIAAAARSIQFYKRDLSLQILERSYLCSSFLLTHLT